MALDTQRSAVVDTPVPRRAAVAVGSRPAAAEAAAGNRVPRLVGVAAGNRHRGVVVGSRHRAAEAVVPWGWRGLISHVAFQKFGAA
jgi:hypothetical protein